MEGLLDREDILQQRDVKVLFSVRHQFDLVGNRGLESFCGTFPVYVPSRGQSGMNLTLFIHHGHNTL
jgi:hypothetical protein